MEDLEAIRQKYMRGPFVEENKKYLETSEEDLKPKKGRKPKIEVIDTNPSLVNQEEVNDSSVLKQLEEISSSITLLSENLSELADNLVATNNTIEAHDIRLHAIDGKLGIIKEVLKKNKEEIDALKKDIEMIAPVVYRLAMPKQP